ncbi:MAG: hypothetical protein ACYTG0_32905 [Planctomycetota bacterium]|jgi:hypothetical protein
MKRLVAVCPDLAILAACEMDVAAGQEKTQVTRTWTDNTGEYTVEITALFVLLQSIAVKARRKGRSTSVCGLMAYQTINAGRHEHC